MRDVDDKVSPIKVSEVVFHLQGRLNANEEQFKLTRTLKRLGQQLTHLRVLNDNCVVFHCGLFYSTNIEQKNLTTKY
jgi:hypothetical protein